MALPVGDARSGPEAVQQGGTEREPDPTRKRDRHSTFISRDARRANRAEDAARRAVEDIGIEVDPPDRP